MKVLSETFITNYKNINFLKADLVLSLEAIRDEVNKNPIRTAKKVLQLVTDNLPQTVEEKVYKIDCKSGCFFCCAQEVSVTFIEIMLILEYVLDKYSKEEIIQLVKRLKKAEERREKGEKAFCGFLVNELCSIYDVRPINCATYFSNSVEYCEEHDGFAKKLKGDVIHYIVGETIEEFYKRFFSRSYYLTPALAKLLAQENLENFSRRDLLKCLNL